MGTWPIYKKHFLQLILTKEKNLSFDKISPRDFYFFSFLFNLHLYNYLNLSYFLGLCHDTMVHALHFK